MIENVLAPPAEVPSCLSWKASLPGEKNASVGLPAVICAEELLIVPFTSSAAPGLFFPIPTPPLARIRNWFAPVEANGVELE